VSQFLLAIGHYSTRGWQMNIYYEWLVFENGF